MQNNNQGTIVQTPIGQVTIKNGATPSDGKTISLERIKSEADTLSKLNILPQEKDDENGATCNTTTA
jgi:hypothetical protein